jgi:hypothetical protein
MTKNPDAGQQGVTPMRVSVEYRRPITSRHRARYIVWYRGGVVPVIPGKDWEHTEAYILAAAKVTGIPPEEFGTDYNFYRTTGWRWFTTTAGTSKDLPLAQRGLGVPRR